MDEPEPDPNPDPKFPGYGAFCGWEHISASAFLEPDVNMNLQKGVGNGIGIGAGDDWSAMGLGFWLAGEALS